MCAQPKMGNGRRVSLGFGGASAAIGDHIAHFYRGSNQRFDVLGPYFKEGIQNGDKRVLISAPEVASELCDWLTSNDIDAAGARASRQLILHPGAATMEEMQTLTERIEADSFKEGHKFVRWAGDMGWGLEGNFSVSEMLRWASFAATRWISQWLHKDKALTEASTSSHKSDDARRRKVIVV